MDNVFVSRIMPPDNFDDPSWWMIFDGFRLLVYDQALQARVPLLRDPAEIGIEVTESQYLGYLDDPVEPLHVFCAEAKNHEILPDGMAYLTLRQLFSRLELISMGHPT